MPRLYTVEMRLEVVVVAESDEDARDAALEGWRGESSISVAVESPEPLRRFPFRWSDGALPWKADGSLPEKTIREWIDAGAEHDLPSPLAGDPTEGT